MFRQIIAVLAILTCVTRVAAKDLDPATLAPDTTLAILQFRDVTKMEEDWKKTGVSKLWDDPQMQRFTKPLRDRLSGPPTTPPLPGAAAKPARGANAPAQNQLEDSMLARLRDLSWADFKAMFPGGFAVFVADMDFLENGAMTFDLCIVGKAGKERKDYDRIVNIISPAPPASPERTTFDVEGVTVYQTRYAQPGADQILPSGVSLKPSTIERGKYTTVQVAIMDAGGAAGGGQWVLIADGSRDTVRNMIQRAKGRRQDSLAAAPNYAAAMKETEKDAHIIFYADLVSIGEGLDSLWRASFGSRATGAPGAPGSQPLSSLAGFHLDDLKSLAISASFGPEAIRTRSRIALKPEPEGIGKLLAAMKRDCQFATARYAPEDAVSYNGSAWDLKEFYHSAENLLRLSSRDMNARIDEMLLSLRTELEFDPVAEIVDQLGGEEAQIAVRVLAEVGSPAVGGGPLGAGGAMGAGGPIGAGAGSRAATVYLFECRDGKRLRAAQDKLEKYMQKSNAVEGVQQPESPLEKSDYLGFQICSPKDQGQTGGPVAPFVSMPAWAITDTWLVASSRADAVKQTLRLIAGKETRSFAKTDQFKKARALFQGSVSEMSYSDLSEMAVDTLQGVQMASFMLTMVSRGRVPSNFLDFSAIPDRAVFRQNLGPSISATSHDPDALSSLWIIQSLVK